MKLFVTGGTGFIGSHFVDRAMQSGHELYCLRHKEQPRITLTREPRWIDGELAIENYPNAVKNSMLQASDALVHFAAVGVSPQVATWDELFLVNVAQSAALWRHAIKCGIRRFLICGSCFEYNPITGYGASKASATIAARAMAKEFDVEVSVLRPFNVFGDGQHASNFWPSLRRAALVGEDFHMTAGEQVRHFTHVSLVADAFLLALESQNDSVKDIEAGSTMTLRQFAEHWWNEWGATGKLVFDQPYRPNEIMRFVPQL